MTRWGRAILAVGFALLLWAQQRDDKQWSPRLILHVLDAETGQPTAARFSLLAAGEAMEPRSTGPHGLRFVSVHVSKRQTYVVTYARGTGPVEAPLHPDAKRLTVRVTKGFDYTPVEVTAQVDKDPVEVTVRLERWNHLREDGWRAADAHVHYDRVEPAGDRDWFHMMAGDDLTHAQFMVLKGGMVPGIWARQYAYGTPGEGTDGARLIVPGEEFRDRLQGHLLFFGMSEVIEPIMAGTRESPDNWPVFADVLQRARDLGGMVGAAHGASLGGSPTGLADAVVGKLDFMELGNLFLWSPELWYRLMNCGFDLPPTAGSDLPNVPYRDGWQPFLGSIRTYVKVGDERGSAAWNRAVKRGETFVTSGPVIRLAVNGAGPGGTVTLPAGGGEVTIEATLSGPRELRSLELLRNGEVVETAGPGPKRLMLKTTLRVDESCWFAARGTGARIEAMRQDALAHTAAVRVLVGGRRIWSEDEAEGLRQQLRDQREFYRNKGQYSTPARRQRALEVFDEALQVISTLQ